MFSLFTKLILLLCWSRYELLKSDNKNNLKQNNMFKNKKNTAYQTPQIERIVLDNEISLQLESTPPVGPGGEIVMKK